MAVMIAWAFVTKDSHDFSRQVIISWFAAAAVAQMGVHIGLNYLIRAYLTNHREVIPSVLVGNCEMGVIWPNISMPIPGRHIKSLA